jgi:hypothetical protein
MISRALLRQPVTTLLLCVIDAGGDPGVFCYRMGVDIFSAGRERFLMPAAWVAHRAAVKRNQDACGKPFSNFSTRCSTRKG